MAGMNRADSTQAMRSIVSAYGDDVPDDPEPMSDGGIDAISDEEDQIDRKLSHPDNRSSPESPGKRENDEQVPTPQKRSKNDRQAMSRLVSYGRDDIDEEDDENEKEDSNSDEEGENQLVNYELSFDHQDLNASMQQNQVETDDDGEVKIPPEPTGKCSRSLQEKIKKMVEKVYDEGLNLSNSIQNKKEYRNPSIYEKLVEYIGIDQKGTNYPPELFNPMIWGQDSHYDELAKIQKEEMDKREKEKKDRTKVEFVSGTKKSSDGSGEHRRKSKWDSQPQILTGVKPQVITTTSLNPPVISVTTSVAGVKTSVISAVGTLKKPK